MGDFKVFFGAMVREVVKKNGYFTVRLTVRGGSAPPGLTVAFVKILGLKTH